MNKLLLVGFSVFSSASYGAVALAQSSAVPAANQRAATQPAPAGQSANPPAAMPAEEASRRTANSEPTRAADPAPDSTTTQTKSGQRAPEVQADPATDAPNGAPPLGSPQAGSPPVGSANPNPAPAPGAVKLNSPKVPWWDWGNCKAPESENGANLSTDCSGVFGLRGTVTRSSGVSPQAQYGLMVSSEGEEYVRRGLWTARSLHRLAIGGGEAGFEGTMLGGWAGGVRLPISPCRRHGPLLRVGMYGYVRGNDAFYASLLELPQLQLGYQYQNGKTVVELGATSGAVLVGRSRIGDAQRRVVGTGFEYGGYAAIQLPWLRLGVSANRLPVDDALATPVDVVEGTLCARFGGVALCTDARRMTTNAFVTADLPAREVRSFYAGLTLGVTRE